MTKAPSADEINKYILLDNQIHELEIKNTRKAFEELEGRLKSLKEENIRLKDDVAKKSKKTEAEKADVDKLTKTMEETVLAKGMGGYQKEMKKEEAEYLEALSAQEMAQKFLGENEKEIKEVEKKATLAKEEFEKLDKLCKEQEGILNSIFKGSYGSALENKLEADLDMHLERKQRIDIAHYKWTNGRALLQHSCNQLSVATNCWEGMKKIPMNDTTKRYQEATKVRNNLIAAIQNVTSTHKYLENITFPYCKNEEMQTLMRAADNIYTDMTNEDRAYHANQCYSTTHKRCAALLQWFDTVINTTILKDLREATASAVEAEKHLRAERMRLLSEIADQHQITFNVDQLGQKKDEQQGMQELEVRPVGDLQQDNTPAPVQKNIAALPSQDQIFGDMEALKKVHDERIEEYQKIEEMNKARVNQGLEEKLAQRRQRRMKQQVS